MTTLLICRLPSHAFQETLRAGHLPGVLTARRLTKATDGVGYASSKSRAPTEDPAIVCLVRIDFLPVSDAAASAGRPEDRSVLEMMYGRDEEDWDQLADTGLAFLVERARLAKLTSYTELNATLERRTELPGFDFARADERAAMGHLLYLIVERNRPATNLMISALVTYLDVNDAGTGFYAFAQDLGLLPRNASAQARLEFWVRQVDALYRYYSPRRQQDSD